MTCPSCGATPPEGSAFCNGCGARMAIVCASCGASPPPGSKFCNGCGSNLEPGLERGLQHGLEHGLQHEEAARERKPADYTPRHLADKILQSKFALEGERKQVTVLFADVKGSMDLAERVGAEHWHEILDRFFTILAEGVHRFEGTVNQFTGDGIMALFGAPIAHEDHAQRACYAALHLRSELRSYADELRRTEGLSLSARIGVNSGEVIVGKIGDDLRMDYTAQGHTVGLAQRMEQRAAADSTYLTEHTARLVEGYFELRDLGEFDLKGASDPLCVFELEGVGQTRTRLDRSRARGFAKFVGREREITSLDEALEEAITGNGQVVGIVAEAGTGKSRLCVEFVARCRERGIRVNEAHCPAHGKTIPYLPLLEILRDIFEIGDHDSDHETRRKITGELMLLDDQFHAVLPLLFEFLGAPDPERPAPEMSPEGRQQQLFGFVRHLQQVRSEREPTVVLMDDLHWIDPGSDEFLAHAVDAAQGHRTLMLVNFRPEYHAGWMTKSYYRQIPLQPLGREAIGLLLEDLIGSDPSVSSLPDRVYARTGGNPFFVEEVVQSLVENGSLEGARGACRLVASIEALEIPPTVQSVLAARVDRLAEREKQLLQTASVIEKEFAESILKRVTNLPDSDLAESLAALVQGEFLLEKALYPEAEYAFKHPLTQEVAYRSLLGERRARLHAEVARAIEEGDVDRLDERAALLAYHWENAGDPLTAARWHARAARWAGADSPVEALRHWEKIWTLLPRPPESEEAVSLLLDSAGELLALGFRQGLGIDAAKAIFEEARAWAVERGDARKQLTLLYGFGCAYLLGGDPTESLSVFNEALALADRDGDTEMRWSGREPLVAAYNWLGQLQRANAITAEMIELLQVDPTVGSLISLHAEFTYSNRAWGLTDLGRFEEAAESFERAADMLRRDGANELLSFTQAFHTRMLVRSGDVRGALLLAQRSVETAEQVGSFVGLVNAYAHQGMALALNGDWEPARDRLELALEIAREHRVWITIEGDFVAALAEVHLALGDGPRARAMAEEAVQITLRTKTLPFEVRARLAVARVRLALDGAAARDEIEAALDRASELVEQTDARSFEPLILEERARLATALGDAETAGQLTNQAIRLFRELGATGHAERLGS